MSRHTSRPAVLFAGWLVHDLEEIVGFPATTELLARRLGLPWLRVNLAQSAVAVALVGLLVGVACVRGARTNGESKLFCTVAAGLEAHVVTHVAATVVAGEYTAGVLTAPTVMLPAARAARGGAPLAMTDALRGAALLLPAAALSHVVARILVPSRR